VIGERTNGPNGSQVVDIVTSCDNAYPAHTIAFLRSLLHSNPSAEFRVFVLVPEDSAFQDVIASALPSGMLSLHFLRVDHGQIASLKTSFHFTTASYYRLFLGELLPTDVHRAIHLDSDVLVAGSLSELWNMEVAPHIIAAVPDCVVDNEVDVRSALGLSEEMRYFNAGVMLIDLDRWREERIGQRALEVVQQSSGSLKYLEQCALNALVRGRYKVLPEKWNFQSDHVARDQDGRVSDDALMALGEARIVHFTGRMKPWVDGCRHPMKDQYFQFANEVEGSESRVLTATRPRNR
jgi:lipopolysaccharide biosynthesis glycosyltransferase